MEICGVINSAAFYKSINFYGRQICRVVNISSSYTELSVYIPKFYGWFQYNICYIARSYFASSLVLDMYEMSIVLNVDNSISRSHLPGCLFLKVYMIPYLEGWYFSCHCLLSCLNSVLI